MPSTRHFSLRITTPFNAPPYSGDGAYLVFVTTGTTSGESQTKITGSDTSARCYLHTAPSGTTQFTIITSESSATTIYGHVGVIRAGAAYCTGGTAMTLSRTSSPTTAITCQPYYIGKQTNTSHYVRKEFLQKIFNIDYAMTYPYNIREYMSNKASGLTYNSTKLVTVQVAQAYYFNVTDNNDASTTPPATSYVRFNELYFNTDHWNIFCDDLKTGYHYIIYRTATTMKITNNESYINYINIQVSYGGNVTFNYNGVVSAGTNTYTTTENNNGSPSNLSSGQITATIQVTNAQSSFSSAVEFYAGEARLTGTLTNNGILRMTYDITRDIELTADSFRLIIPLGH